jgi:hypothetical protein
MNRFLGGHIDRIDGVANLRNEQTFTAKVDGSWRLPRDRRLEHSAE